MKKMQLHGFKTIIFSAAKKITKLESNSACTFWAYQPKLPEGAKRNK